jgi:hypothetical protein
VRPQSKGLKLYRCWFSACGILATVEVSANRQAGLSFRRANELQDFLVAVEGFAGPVLGDLGEEPVLNGVPFGSARGIVGNGESQPERVGQLRLKFGFPSAASSAITAAGVAEDEELAGARIADGSLLAPPMGDGASSEGGSVMGDAHRDRSSIRE